MCASPSHLPAANCPHSRSVQNRYIEQQTSVLPIFSFPESVPIAKKNPTNKNLGKKKYEKKPIAFFQILSPKLFIEFLTFEGWSCLRGTDNCLYHRYTIGIVHVYHS